MKPRHLIILIGLIVSSDSFAQTLEELYHIADQNAKAIRVSQDALMAASEAVANARAQRLPDIGAQLSLGYNGRGIITDRDFSNAMNIYIPEFGNNFSLQVSQVLFAGGAISNSIRLSEMGRQMAELDVEKNRQEVRFYITGRYLDMMKTQKTLKVIEQNIALTEQLIDNMKARVSQGTSLKNDITRYELQLESLRLQHAQLVDACSIMNYDLCQTLSLPDDTKIVADEGMLAETFAAQDEQYWQRQTAIGNSGLKQAALAGGMAEKKVRLAKSAQLPKLAFVAEDHLNGPVTIEIPALNKNFNYWFAGVGVQYSLSSLYKSRNDIRRAKLEQNKAAEQLALARERISTEVKAAYTNLNTAYTELQTCEKKVQLANENYSVVSNRYNNGLSLITDMLDASNMKLAAEIAREQACINIVYCHKKLEYLTGNL